jgi:hypothetical protein
MAETLRDAGTSADGDMNAIELAAKPATTVIEIDTGELLNRHRPGSASRGPEAQGMTHEPHGRFSWDERFPTNDRD